MLRIVLEGRFPAIELSCCFGFIYIRFTCSVCLTAPSSTVHTQRQISHSKRRHAHLLPRLPTLNCYNIFMLLNICVWLSPLSWHNNPTRLSPSAESRQFHLWSLEELTGDDGGQSRSFARARRLKVADERLRWRWVALPTDAFSATLKSD